MFDPSFARNLDGLYAQNNPNNVNNVLFRSMPLLRSGKRSNNNNETSMNTFDNSIIGMPVRSFNQTVSNDQSRDSKNNDQYKSRDQMSNVDFNLYDQQTNLNVTSYEAGGNGLAYSEISSFGSPLLTPLKQSPEYFMTLFINCLAFDTIIVMNNIMQTKFYCVCPSLIVGALNYVYGLLSTNLYADPQPNHVKDLAKFFQGKSSEYINTSLARLNSDIKNFSSLQFINIALINNNTYQQHASEFNKYFLGTCVSFPINEPNRQLLLHSVNNMIKSNLNKLNNASSLSVTMTPEALIDSAKTNNPVFLYNFSTFILQTKEPFLKKDTKKGFFYELNSNKKLVNYMKRTKTNALAYQDNNVTLIELECNNGTNLGILISNNLLKYQQIETYINSLKMTSFEYIIIPKIKYQTKIKLNETLKRMNLNNLFCNGNIINKGKGISLLEHNVMVLLDDVATVNNSTTDTMINSAPLIDDKKLKFKANKPFLFYVRTVNNNCINLAGRFC
jgi:hypothetical protein